MAAQPEKKGYLGYLHPIRDTFFKENKPVEAFTMLEPVLNNTKNYSRQEATAIIELGALIMRKRHEYKKASTLYQLIGDFYQAGYCHMLDGELHLSQQHWIRVIKEQRNTHWCAALFGLVTG